MDIHSTRTMRGVNCWTDHQMLRSTVAFRILQKHNRQGASNPTKLNTGNLSTTSHRECFEQKMDSALAQWEEKEGSTQTRNGQVCRRRIQHSQDIYWQARQKTPGLVRPERPGATDSYEHKRPSPPECVCCKQGALDPPLQHTNMPADCYKNAPVH